MLAQDLQQICNIQQVLQLTQVTKLQLYYYRCTITKPPTNLRFASEHAPSLFLCDTIP